jgi:hypothetical protein
MISQPSTPVIVEVVCAQLESKVGPVLDGPTRIVLDMALGLLRAAAVRSAHEIGWMREEGVEIESTARRLLDQFTEREPLVEALLAYDAAKRDSRHLDDAQAEYEQASEVLSRLAEAAYGSGRPDLIAEITRLYRQRIDHANAVTGVFVAAGRT